MAHTDKKLYRVTNLIVDSAGFIKNVPLQDIGENIYTDDGVINEIRDKTTRERLQVLPYELLFKRPTADDIKFVTEFSKKTGDYRSLSAIDLRVIALTYHMEREIVGEENIRREPFKKEIRFGGAKTVADAVKNEQRRAANSGEELETIGESSAAEQSPDGEVASEHDDDGWETVKIKAKKTKKKVDLRNENRPLVTRVACLNVDSLCQNNIGGDDDDAGRKDCDGDEFFGAAENNEESDDDDDEYEDCEEYFSNDVDDETQDCDEEEDDDDEGWVTSDNINDLKEVNDVTPVEMGDPIHVACLTTDYAIQNVLLQLGLKVVSVEGMLIKNARMYVLRCYSCFKITTEMTKRFCPNCGHNTLRKTSCSVNEDGTVTYYMSKRKPPSTKGLRYSLPTPRGGKFSNDPILFEDQRVPQQRISKRARSKMDPMQEDYVAGNSPFVMQDVNSRSRKHGFNVNRAGGWGNPNANKKRHTKKK